MTPNRSHLRMVERRLEMFNKLRIGRNTAPVFDGDLTLYDCSKSGKAGVKRVIYVNGIGNTPTDHKGSCRNLQQHVECEVVGVYNGTGLGADGAVQDAKQMEDGWSKILTAAKNIAVDIGQCAVDWISIGSQALHGPRVTPNKAVSSLYGLLLPGGMTWPSSPLCIVAHSQGNLVTSNALFAYSKAVREFRLIPAPIHVFAVASPCPSWPTNSFISVTTYRHLFDGVPWLSLGRNLRGELTGAGAVTKATAAHGVDSYFQDGALIGDIRRKLGIG